MAIELTVDALKEAKFRGPVRFSDGRNGMAQQDFECVDEPRFGYFWRREDRKDKGRQAFSVDGQEVTNLDEACRLLALLPDPNSPRELMRKSTDEFHTSPKMNYGATRALSVAQCSIDDGPFAMMWPWTNRSSNAYHSGINAYSEKERKAERGWPHWLYEVKAAAYEVSRLFGHFQRDRENDLGLKCALGVTCRSCPILNDIATAMVEMRNNKIFPNAIEDSDVDAAKAWTCVGHILTSGVDHVVDGTFFTTEADKKEDRYF